MSLLFVSIRLMSPASGNYIRENDGRSDNRVVSIRLMSPASGNVGVIEDEKLEPLVSIRLMSPASGNIALKKSQDEYDKEVSIRLMSPASGNPCILTPYPVRSLEALSEVQET